MTTISRVSDIAGPKIRSGPVKIAALGPARLAGALLRVRGFLHWAAGTLAFASVAVPRPCDAPGHRATDWLRQGIRHL